MNLLTKINSSSLIPLSSERFLSGFKQIYLFAFQRRRKVFCWQNSCRKNIIVNARKWPIFLHLLLCEENNFPVLFFKVSYQTLKLKMFSFSILLLLLSCYTPQIYGVLLQVESFEPIPMGSVQVDRPSSIQ